jgi:hypothetical protein
MPSFDLPKRKGYKKSKKAKQKRKNKNKVVFVDVGSFLV